MVRGGPIDVLNATKIRTVWSNVFLVSSDAPGGVLSNFQRHENVVLGLIANSAFVPKPDADEEAQACSAEFFSSLTIEYSVMPSNFTGSQRLLNPFSKSSEKSVAARILAHAISAH